MDLVDLEQGLRLTASGGHVLNCSELMGLQAALTLLKSQEKVQSIYFWGKIFGTSADYFIAYSMKEKAGSDFPEKAFYYAGEDFEFKTVPTISQETAENIIQLKLTQPFEGVPGASIELEEGQQGVKLLEAERLAQVLLEIDFDTAVAPKGAHALNESNMILPNLDFKGLPASEATALSKYVHFRPPASVVALRAAARTDTEFFAHFLDALEGDLPKGCWAVRQDPSANVVMLKSLNWPGYIAYHVPGTPKFGGMYFGYAQKNRDLPFMI